MLSGDNGILQRATDAKEYENVAQIQEQINLAYHSALVNGQGEVTEASLETELKNEFNKTTLDEDWLDKTSMVGKWIITIDGISLEVPAGIENDNEVIIKVGATNLKDVSQLSNLYGETTDYSSVNGVQWQLFYDDDSYIYLIAKDYVPINTLPNELLKETQVEGETKYKAWFANYSNSGYTGTIMENTPWSNGTESNTFTANTVVIHITSNYLKWVNSTLVRTKNTSAMKAMAFMMDTNKWSNFAGEASGATAIGGPTLEMFALSYNAKHDTKLGTYGTSSSDITWTNATQLGYKVKIGTGSWSSDYISGLDTTTTDTDGNMWVRTSDTNAKGYWITSTFGELSYSVNCIYAGGQLGGSQVSKTLYRVSPINFNSKI